MATSVGVVEAAGVVAAPTAAGTTRQVTATTSSAHTNRGTLMTPTTWEIRRPDDVPILTAQGPFGECRWSSHRTCEVAVGPLDLVAGPGREGARPVLHCGR